MENASKALIIAGAILLAILIISLGILIYNQASSVVQSNAMSQVEIQQFNQQFTQYEGPSVKGSTVRALYQAVLANNVSQDSASKKVSITNAAIADSKGNLDSTHSKMPEGYANIPTGSSYEVTCNYATTGGNAGLVTSITIKDAS